MTTTVFAPTSSEAARYHAILQSKIDAGARRAASVIEEIHKNQPTDRIARTDKIGFGAAEQGPGGVGIVVKVGDTELRPSDFALGQLAERAGMPTAYLRELATAAEPWKRDLAAHALARHTANGAAERVLVRSVGGQLRGWLSDRFRRLDSRPLVDALAAEAQALGAIPIDGTATETRVALKVLLPEVLEPIPGEFLVRGGEWSNSDYGNGVHGFRRFDLRVTCLNGATRENVLRQIHLGGRLGDDIQYSNRTLMLDTKASVSALRDVVRGVLGPASKDAFVESIKAAHAKKMGSAALKVATKNLDKKTQKAVVDAFESEDVINLPAGETVWRASNAISWIARHTEDAEKRLDLERAAGALV